jgi:hypothetical protein
VENLTWRCHICGAERPDDKIGVRQHLTTIRGIEVTQNVRYCTDRPDCIIGAESFRFVRETL